MANLNGYYYIWVKWSGFDNYEPHITFLKDDEGKADAAFEIEHLRESGHKAKYGNEFP